MKSDTYKKRMGNILSKDGSRQRDDLNETYDSISYSEEKEKCDDQPIEEGCNPDKPTFKQNEDAGAGGGCGASVIVIYH